MTPAPSILNIAARALASALLLAGSLASFPTASQSREWDFRVFLGDSAIGYHRFTLREEGAQRELTNEARFNVKVLGITAYRYSHDTTERWRGNCLAALSARTNDDGERLTLTAAREGDRLMVSGDRSRDALDGCVMTFAYWNPEILKQTRLLNAQTGEYEWVRVARLGEETIAVRGAQVSATRSRITGSRHPIDLWYSAQQEWLALDSTVDGRRRLRYRLL